MTIKFIFHRIVSLLMLKVSELVSELVFSFVFLDEQEQEIGSYFYLHLAL